MKLLVVFFLMCVTSCGMCNQSVNDSEWTGAFQLGNKIIVQHLPNRVAIAVGGSQMSSGKALNLSQGSIFMGLQLKEDIELKVNMPVSEFVKELRKFGEEIVDWIINGEKTPSLPA
jgi:hypothetical protein